MPALGVVVWLLGALPAAAMTEFCMQDGADVKDTFFAAPTTDTTPVRVVMAGITYSIPRNYFRFPQVECRTSETRDMVLRMTLPDFLPATKKTWDRLYGKSAGANDNFIQVLASQQTIRDMARLLKNHSREEIKDRHVPQIEGLRSFAQGPLTPKGWHEWDVYYAPDRDTPKVMIICDPIRKGFGSTCRIYFLYNGIVWDPWIDRKNLPRWREIISGLKAKTDKFVLKK